MFLRKRLPFYTLLATFLFLVVYFSDSKSREVVVAHTAPLQEHVQHLHNTIKKTVEDFFDDDDDVSTSPPAQKYELTEMSIMIYKAHYETRSDFPYLRISVNAKSENFRKSEYSAVLPNGTRIKLKPAILNGGWVEKGCLYNTFELLSDRLDEVPEEITIFRGNNSATVPVFPVVNKSTMTPGLTVCIEPMYWFTDWPRLVVFMELWKLHGATKVLFYYTTVTRNTMKVLQYYVDEGIADVRAWPLMPSTTKVDPNNSTYQITEHLEEHECTIRSTTKFTALNDIDEFLFPFKGKLMDYLNRLVLRDKFKDAGSFYFDHGALGFDPPIVPIPYQYENSHFKGLLKPIVNDKFEKRMGKTIALTEYTSIQMTHRLEVHFKGKKAINVPRDEARSMHARNSYAYTILKQKNELTADIFAGENATFHQERIDRVTRTIFPDTTPYYSLEATKAVGACVGDWVRTQHNCKNVHNACKDALSPLDDWIYAEPTKDSHYYIL